MVCKIFLPKNENPWIARHDIVLFIKKQEVKVLNTTQKTECNLFQNLHFAIYFELK